MENISCGAKNQAKCEKCGSTDLHYSISKQKLLCSFCHTECLPKPAYFINEEIENLDKFSIGLGAEDIDREDSGLITLKCDSCGSEVVLNTNDHTSSNCPWCRNVLSINNAVPNGTVPDAILPFIVTKDDAIESIKKYTKNKRFFALSKFKRSFHPDNIEGIYLPYMIIDNKCHIDLCGYAEEKLREHEVNTHYSEDGTVSSSEKHYDANEYYIERHFDMYVDDLSLESSHDKLDSTKEKTNYIINSIMPFDTKNCVIWDANYLRGYSSIKRDTDFSELGKRIKKQNLDIARIKARSTTKIYDRGVRWEDQQVNFLGLRCFTIYAPVWIYGFHETKKDNKNILHYLAVNGRTKKTMGSIPFSKPKLVTASILLTICAYIIFQLLMYVYGHTFYGTDPSFLSWIFGWLFTAPVGILFYLFKYWKYSSKDSRFCYERDVMSSISNIQCVDKYIQELTDLPDSSIFKRNDTEINGYE